MNNFKILNKITHVKIKHSPRSVNKVIKLLADSERMQRINISNTSRARILRVN